MKTLLCYCGNTLEITEEYLGFDEYECSRCDQFVSIPDDFTEFETHNEQIRKELNELKFTGRIRIMAVQETGEVSCYRTLPEEDDEELISLIMAGYQLLYPECNFFTEREKNMRYVVNQQFLDERI